MCNTRYFITSAPNGVKLGTIITTPTFITVFLEPIPGVTAHEVRVMNVENVSDVRTVDPRYFRNFSLSHVAMYVVVCQNIVSVDKCMVLLINLTRIIFYLFH